MSTTNEPHRLKFPRMCYGTICNKILKEFNDYHKIENLPLPDSKDGPHAALEKIFNCLISTLPEDKRKEIVKDAWAYLNDLPPNVR